MTTTTRDIKMMYLMSRCCTPCRIVTSSRMRVSCTRLGTPLTGQKRRYHDESFGYRPPPRYVFPDCEFGVVLLLLPSLPLAVFSFSIRDVCSKVLPTFVISLSQIPKSNSSTETIMHLYSAMSIRCAHMDTEQHVSIHWIWLRENMSQP